MSIPNNANVFLPGVICIPSTLQITGITNSFPMVISYTFNSSIASPTYQNGQLIRLNIPKPYGMFQANGLMGQVISSTSSTITLNIDSTLFDTFVTPSAGAQEPASLSPAGSQNLAYNNSTNKVPFQSLNNIGN